MTTTEAGDISINLWRDNRLDQEYTTSADDLLAGFAQSIYADPNRWWGGLTARLVAYITSAGGLDSTISLGLDDTVPSCTEAEWDAIEERASAIVWPK